MSVNISEHATTNPTTLPPVANVPSLDVLSRAEILDLLFEPCTQLHTLSLPLLHENTFESYKDLISAVGEQFRVLQKSQLESDRAWLDKILAAHPRLGKKKLEDLSDASRKEQGAMNAADGAALERSKSEEQTEKLKALNEEYEKTFGGLRYVTFVNGRSRPLIMEDMEKRIQQGDLEQEKTDAIQAMCDIAVDRAQRMGAS